MKKGCSENKIGTVLFVCFCNQSPTILATVFAITCGFSDTAR